jgi:hypothetical protein
MSKLLPRIDSLTRKTGFNLQDYNYDDEVLKLKEIIDRRLDAERDLQGLLIKKE